MLTNKRNVSHGNSFVRKGNVIRVVLAGPQPDNTSREALSEFKRLVTEIRAEGGKPFVFVDLRNLDLKDVTVASRIAIKEAFSLPYVALAAVGKTKLLEIAMYLINAGGANARVRYFTSERRASAWLAKRQMAQPSHTNTLIFAATVIGLLGVAGLVGWWMQNTVLTSIVPGLRPINPMAAVGLIALSLAFVATKYAWRRAIRVASGAMIAIGVLAILPPVFGFDHWLFGTAVAAVGPHAQFADTAAACFVLMGVLFIIRQSKTLRYVRALLELAVTAISLFSAAGLLYASDFMYSISPTFAMAFPLALAFVFASFTYGFERLGAYRKKATLGHITGVGWMVLIAMIGVQVATYVVWQLAVNTNKASVEHAFEQRIDVIKDNANTRLRAYTDVLRGFKGFFGSSSYVAQGEFEAYYNTTDVAKNYPGLRTMSFISEVTTKELPVFVARHRADTSLIPGGNPHFTIQQQSKSNTHYIVTYIAGNPTSQSYGIDFADNASRRATYEKAKTTGMFVASDTIPLSVGAGNGFFVTLPVSAQDMSTSGYVSVVFAYDDLFNNLINESQRANVDITVTDTQSPTTPLYQSRHKTTKTAHATTIPVTVADRTWNITVEADRNFGKVENSQLYTPLWALLAGQVFSGLLGVVFILQNNARKRALTLADTITADLQHERNEAIATKEKDETILRGIADGLIIFDKDARIIRLNNAGAAMLGYSEDEMRNKRFEEVLSAYDEKDLPIPTHRRPVVRTITQGKVVQQRMRYVRKNGTHIDVQIATSPLLHEGRLAGVIEIFRDITKEQELDRAKSEFVSLASHQLRTPLSAINWYAEMLLAGDAGKLTKDQHEYIAAISDGNKRMVELVDSLLNVSRLEVGKLKNEPKEVQPNEVAESLRTELQSMIETHKLTYVANVPAALPTMSVDPKLFRMVIQNLLSNAVKYTPKGSVTLTMHEASTKEIAEAKLPTHHDYLFISVADTGYGIPKDQQPKIFGKLYRADNVRKLDVEGTGLGLYIVKEVVEMLGGKIWFESVENVGTTFYAVIPLKTLPSK